MGKSVLKVGVNGVTVDGEEMTVSAKGFDSEEVVVADQPTNLF